MASLQGPQPLREPEWGAEGFCFSRIVQPVLDKHCVECHNPLKKEAKIDLSGDRTDFFNVAYETLARVNHGRTGSRFVSWIPTYNGEEWNIQQITPKYWGSPASPLAELVLSGHPDESGKPRVNLSDAERRRIFTWIDLNVPYYGRAETAHPELPGCRQMFPKDLPKVMSAVYARRCQSCHESKKVQPAITWRSTEPPPFGGGLDWWNEQGVRIESPQLNEFLLAPLAKAAGGTEICGEPIFRDKNDPDYQAVLKTFEPVAKLMAERPRMDMPNPAPSCCIVNP
jgi:hypothetical protein